MPRYTLEQLERMRSGAYRKKKASVANQLVMGKRITPARKIGVPRHRVPIRRPIIPAEEKIVFTMAFETYGELMSEGRLDVIDYETGYMICNYTWVNDYAGQGGGLDDCDGSWMRMEPYVVTAWNSKGICYIGGKEDFEAINGICSLEWTRDDMLEWHWNWPVSERMIVSGCICADGFLYYEDCNGRVFKADPYTGEKIWDADMGLYPYYFQILPTPGANSFLVGRDVDSCNERDFDGNFLYYHSKGLGEKYNEYIRTNLGFGSVEENPSNTIVKRNADNSVRWTKDFTSVRKPMTVLDDDKVLSIIDTNQIALLAAEDGETIWTAEIEDDDRNKIYFVDVSIV